MIRNRKRLTQIFSWLFPFRKKQRMFFFYLKMHFDKNHYARSILKTDLPYKLFENHSPLYNRETGFDMLYQENKVFNLKLAAPNLNGLLIKPGETFSFCLATRYADRQTQYKDGLTVIDGKLTTEKGGGMCQMSNLLFLMFLHTPLTIIERHGHGVKNFKESENNALMGIDATISRGWLDLKLKNETNFTFQICIDFDAENIIGRIFIDEDIGIHYELKNEELIYFRKDNAIFEQVKVYRSQISDATGEKSNRKLLYENSCKIGYKLPLDTKVN
ncbi:MAG: glycopeptide resistance accessory protein VanW [Clostridia bacterium]